MMVNTSLGNRDDNINELTETFIATLTTMSVGCIIDEPAQVEIIDDDGTQLCVVCIRLEISFIKSHN